MMYMKLKTVIERNREQQRKARDLNIRAGSDVFPIMSRTEWREWLAQRLNGARCAMEVVDFESLQLPQLDPELVQLVITENPDTVTIEGVSLQIEYGKEYYGGGVYCRTSVEEEFARGVKADAVLLPSGRTVEIRCSGHSAKSFAELVEKLERSRIERCWSEARREHKTSWTSDSAKVVGWLSKVGSSIEITRTENGNGVPIYGFVGLKRYSGYSEWQLFLAETEEKAAEETQKSLEVLIKAAVKEQLAIPQEEPWQSKSTGWYSSWSLTDLGNALQARYESLVTEHAENLNSSNIEERIEALKAAMEAAKTEIGGDHAEVKQLIETTEQEVEALIEKIDDRYFVETEIEQAREAIRNAKDYLKSAVYDDAKASCKIAAKTAGQLQSLCTSRSQTKREAEDARSEVSDELYNLQYGYDEYDDATQEERSEADDLSRDISNALSDRRYEVVIEKVAEAQKLIARVKAAMPDRQAARRARFPEAVWEAVGDDEYTAEKAVELAKTAADFVGKEKALRVFEQESNAHYGRVRRQDAVCYSMYQIAQTEIGDSFLNLYRARDVDAWLAGAVACLEADREIEKLKDQVAESKSGEGTFTKSGGRYFQCSCGRKERVTKSEMRTYKSGGTLEITCSICGAQGTVSENQAETKEESDGQSMESALDVLKRKWDSR
jgi:hypothetical protein